MSMVPCSFHPGSMYHSHFCYNKRRPTMKTRVSSSSSVASLLLLLSSAARANGWSCTQSSRLRVRVAATGTSASFCGRSPMTTSIATATTTRTTATTTRIYSRQSVENEQRQKQQQYVKEEEDDDDEEEECNLLDPAICSQFTILTCTSKACSQKRTVLGMDEYATFAAMYSRKEEADARGVGVEESPCLGRCELAPCVAVEHDDYVGTVGLVGMTDAELNDRVFHK